MSSGSDLSMRPKDEDIPTLKEHLDEILNASNAWTASYQSADRVADEWTGHVQRAAPAALRVLEKRVSEAQHDAARRSQDAQRQAEEVRRLKAGLAEMREDEAEFANNVSKVDDVLVDMRERIARARREVEDEANVKDGHINLLKAFVSRYRDAYGLRIEAGSEGTKCTFTLVDPLEPQQQFYFVLFTSREGYSVKKCQPPVANHGVLVNELNESKDVAVFFKAMRKEFQKIVTGGSSS